jgi:cell wall-associated NlpC family hydrolase
MTRTFLLLAFLLVTIQCGAQQLLKNTTERKTILGNLSSIVIVHPDTSGIILPGVGENWPLGKQDTARWNSVLRNTNSSSCDNMRNLLATRALGYLGVLYRYGQASEKGFDCSGFVLYVFRTFGFILPHDAVAQYYMSRRITKSEAQPGDLVFFRTMGKQISHVGIYIGNNIFIHSPGRGRSVTTESLEFPYYKSRLAGFGAVL